MIDASFSKNGRDASISGAFQYDTGQRLRMYGLPSPTELLEQDEILSGNGVSVEAHFSFIGDERAESRSATWEEETGTWIVAVPDVYLLKNADVRVYVYVSYGQSEGEDAMMRTKTVYEAVFRPISRPAPKTDVSPNQVNEWQALKDDATAATQNAVDAASNANAATETATKAATAANTAAAQAVTAVNDRLAMLDRTQVAAVKIDATSAPTVEVTNEVDADGKPYKKTTFGIPQSVVTVNGQVADENGNITLTPSAVGALPSDHRAAVEFTATIPTGGWVSGAYVDVSVADILAGDMPIIDVDMSAMSTYESHQVREVLNAWSNIRTIDVSYEGVIRVYALSVPSVAIPIKLLCVR